MTDARRAAYWAAPMLFCLVLYRPTLDTWFQYDDFAWLSMLDMLPHSSLWRELFAPQAQGTIRFWSERAFFLGFRALFDLDPLPYRIWILATQLANLALLMAIVHRLTGSAAAGLLAALFWTAHPALADAITWASSYNQVLAAFFLLLAFWLFLRHIEADTAGERRRARRYWIAQGVIFVLGFGALETNVIYPALAAVYALCCARKYFRKTLPMFAISAAFAAVHLWLIPKQHLGGYTMRFDSAMAGAAWQYLLWSFGAVHQRIENFPSLGFAWELIAGILAGGSLLLFARFELARRQWVAAFLLVWCVLLLAPMLPLTRHLEEYYLTQPVIGLCALGGWAVVRAVGAGPLRGAAAVSIAALWMVVAAPAAAQIARRQYEQGRAVRNLVLGVKRAAELHPGKTILLEGITSDLFYAAIVDQPFRMFGNPAVYLVPGSESRIQNRPDIAEVAAYVLPPAQTWQALNRDDAVVYDASGERLRNVTSEYAARMPAASVNGFSRRVDVGREIFSSQVGSEWHPIDGAFRWMPKRATVRLGGPQKPDQRLHVSGYCPAALVERGAVRMNFSVDGVNVGSVTLDRADHSFEFDFPLPAELAGRPLVTISIEVDRTLRRPDDPREMGMIFGVFAIR
jgi:hypothetical protein